MMLGIWWFRLQKSKFGLCQEVSVCLLSQLSDTFAFHHRCLCVGTNKIILNCLDKSHFTFLSTASMTLFDNQIHRFLFSVLTDTQTLMYF